MSNVYEGFQELVAEVPEIVQPLILAAGATIPYIEGEGAAALGVIGGVNPVVAAVAAAAGNILSVVLVVLLSSRARTSVVAARSRRSSAAAGAAATTAASGTAASGAVASGSVASGSVAVRTLAAPTQDEATPDEPTQDEPTGRRSKGRRRLARWMVRFGVPGTSLLAPLALPTQLTAATFVASGVSRSWVILWQVVAIVVWTGAVTAVATGLLSVVPS